MYFFIFHLLIFIYLKLDILTLMQKMIYEPITPYTHKIQYANTEKINFPF